MLHQLLKKIVSISFNILNTFMLGNLPPFGCVSIVVEKDGKFLVIERSQGQVFLPGGFMRWRESPAQTAVREGKEETGLLLHPLSIIGYQTYASQQLDQMSTINIIYHAEVVSGTLRSSMEGHPIWLYEKHLRERINPANREVLDEYLHYRAQHGTPSAHDIAQSPLPPNTSN